MMRYFLINITLVISLVVFGGCSGSQKSGGTEGEELYAPKYAQGFELRKVGQSSVLKIKDPWQGANDVDMELFISRGGERPPRDFEGVVVEAPIKRLVCMSSSYTAFIEAIDELDVVVGVSGARYISSEALQNRYARGEVRDVGYDNSVNYELIASLRPDLVLVYGVAGENSVMTDKLRELSINVMYIGDYLENTPLGKAEWIVAFGEMLDCRERAEQKFDCISADYNSALELVSNVRWRPRVMLNAPWRDTWFVPGDRSYIVKLIRDAGGVYACEGVDSDKSRPISAEAAYVIANSSDIWVNPNQARSINELTQTNPRFAEIPAVINRHVYNCTRRTTADGGSDFWESGAVYPNVVLRDMIKIIHPELENQYDMYYFIKLE